MTPMSGKGINKDSKHGSCVDISRSLIRYRGLVQRVVNPKP